MDADKQKSLIEQFKSLRGWEERYRLIIAKGKELNALPDEEKSEDLKVKGCQSQVWLKAELSDDGKVFFRADSDAMIVKGLVAIVLEVYSGLTPEQILATPPHFVKELGLDSHLSPSRANGLNSMIKQIMFYGLAFDSLLKSQGRA